MAHIDVGGGESRARAGRWLARATLWAVCAAAAIVPFARVVFHVVHDPTPLPFWDAWSFVPLLLETWRGHLRWDLLWAQANEHRLVIPRLLWLAMAIPSRWDIRLELGLNVLLGIGIVAVLARLVRRTLAAVGWWAPPIVTALAAAMVFTMAAYENWFWGWQIQIFLTVLVTAWVADRLERWDGGDRGTVPLTIATMLAPFTFASGLVLLGLLPVAVAIGGAPLGRWRRTVAVGACSLVVAVSYFHDFSYPGNHPSPWLLLQHPVDWIEYVLAYVGGPVGGLDVSTSIAWGLGGTTIVAVAAVVAWWRAPAARRAVLAWLLLAAYVVGNGGMTGIGRMGFGIGQAFSSRYLTISLLFWVATAALVLLAWATVRDVARRAFGAGLLCAALSWIVFGYVQTWNESRLYFHDSATRFGAGKDCLLDLDHATDRCLGFIAPAPGVARDLARQLRDAGLGPYAHLTLEVPLDHYAQQHHPHTAGNVDSLVVAADRHVVELRGWAIDPVGRGHARGVLVVADGRVMDRVAVDETRPDINATFGRRVRRAGWRYDLSTVRLEPGPHTVTVFSVLADGHAIQAFGERVVEIPE